MDNVKVTRLNILENIPKLTYEKWTEHVPIVSQNDCSKYCSLRVGISDCGVGDYFRRVSIGWTRTER